MKNIVLVGASLSGNKGAAGMVIAPIQNLNARYPGSHFTLLSYFPNADRKINTLPNLTIADGTPLGLIWLFILVFIAMVCRFLKISTKWFQRHGGFRTVDSCHLFLDAGGISFVDGREKFLPFNILWVLPPLMLKKPVVKISQALGPFENPLNRMAANFILPKLDLISARGKKTLSHLKELNLDNVLEFPDITFTMTQDMHDASLSQKYLGQHSQKTLVGISPSQVVLEKCQSDGIAYTEILAQFIDQLVLEGYKVVVFPHSARAKSDKTRNNDVPVLKQIWEQVCEKGQVIFIMDELSPNSLRHLIGECDVFVASRFHAMIAALCTGTPTLVFGWSHKYNEVLKEFELENTALDYSQLTLE